MIVRTYALLALASLFASCGGHDTLSEEDHERANAIGAEASAAVMKALSGQLEAALASGGTEVAVSVCKDVALPLTWAAVRDTEGVSVRRVTLQPRNPANVPDATDRKILGAWAQPGTTPRAEVVGVSPTTARYYRPIFVQEVCLKCHGDPATFSPALRETLLTVYPADRATGYHLGDLRGGFRVEIDLEKSGANPVGL